MVKDYEVEELIGMICYEKCKDLEGEKYDECFVPCYMKLLRGD